MKVWLRKRDARRLKFIAAYGHVTVEVLRRKCFEDQSESAVESWLRRMRKRGWLQSAPLDDRRFYYRLTSKAVIELRRFHRTNVSRAATRPMKPNRKAERHAVLLYCTATDGPMREAYRPSQDAEQFPDIAAHIASGKADPLRHRLFYREGDVVGYLVLDRGQSNLIQSKIKPKVFGLFRWESMRKLVEVHAFRLTVITATENRRQELMREFKENAPPIEWEVVVIPEIESVLPRLNPLRNGKKEVVK